MSPSGGSHPAVSFLDREVARADRTAQNPPSPICRRSSARFCQNAAANIAERRNGDRWLTLHPAPYTVIRRPELPTFRGLNRGEICCPRDPTRACHATRLLYERKFGWQPSNVTLSPSSSLKWTICSFLTWRARWRNHPVQPHSGIIAKHLSVKDRLCQTVERRLGDQVSRSDSPGGEGGSK